jgi:hypothetical protein
MAGFTFDRSKLKSTTAAAQQKQTNELAAKGFGGGKTQFIKITDGENVLRVFPFHPEGGGDNFAEVKCVSWLEVEVDKRDENGKKIPDSRNPDQYEKEIKPKGIFNSKVHGGLEIDLVDEYITFAKDRAIPDATGDSKEEAKKIWEKLVGNKDRKPQKTDKYKPIRPNTSWIAYASKATGKNDDGTFNWGPVCPWEIKKTIKDGMTERAAEYESPDPFSDADEGIPVVVNYNSKAVKPGDYYKTKMLQRKEGNAMVYQPAPLDDAKLQEWFALKPLYGLYVNSFKRSDLEFQIDGLKRLDEKLMKDHPGFSVFQYEEFLDIIEALYELVPEGASATEAEEEAVAEEQAAAAQEEAHKPTPKTAPIAKTVVPAKPIVPTKAVATTVRRASPVPPPVEENDGEGVGETNEPAAEQEVKLTGTSAKGRLEEIKARLGKK